MDSTNVVWLDFFFEDHGTNKKDDGEGKKKVSGIDCETERRLCVGAVPDLRNGERSFDFCRKSS
jgi:hypothetical protein